MTRYASMDTLRRAISPDVRVVDDGAPTATGVTPVTGATEHDEQCALFAWAAANEAQHPELAMLVAIPNGGYRPMATAARLKAEGVAAGGIWGLVPGIEARRPQQPRDGGAAAVD